MPARDYDRILVTSARRTPTGLFIWVIWRERIRLPISMRATSA